MSWSIIIVASLLAATHVSAQSGYNYNKPDKPFGPGGTSTGSGATSTSSGYPSGKPQGPAFPSTPGFGSQIPTGPSFGPSAGQQGAQTPSPSYGSPQKPGFGGPSGSSGPSFGGQQGPSGPSFVGQQGPSKPSFGGPSGPAPFVGQQAAAGPSVGGHGPAKPSYGGQVPSGPTFAGQPGQIPSGPSYGGQGGNQPGQGPTGPTFGGQQGPSYGGQQGDGGHDDGSYVNGDYSAIPGEPDVDYPILSEIPETSFRCDQQQYPGYYADVDTRCQVFHVCANNETYDFLCPNGTIFHQEYLVCVWWNLFDCNTAPSLYGINANIYDYSIIGAQQAGKDGQFPGAQGPSGQFPGTQGPSGPYPAVSQGPGGQFPGAQRPSGNFPGQGPSSQGPGFSPSGPSKPTTTYGPAQGTFAPSAQGPFGPAAQAPSSAGQKPFGGYPSQQPPTTISAGGLPGSRPQDGTSGYPGSSTQQPNREYLPPVNG